MRKVAVVLLMIFVVVGGCACETQETVTSSVIKTEVRQSVDAFGVIKALETKDIVIDFPAFIDKINVKEGQTVSKGDLLATLNIEEYQSSINDKELKLKSIQNQINMIQSYYIESDNSPELQKYFNEIENLENLYNKALKEYEDQEVLFNSGCLSKSELDEAKKTVEALKKDIDSIKFSIETIKFNKKQELDLKEVTLLSLQEELHLMKSKLNDSYMNNNQILSDVNSGVVYDISYVQGCKVDAYQKLFSILDIDSLIVQADIPEDFIKDVDLGAEVLIIPDADNSKKYKGKVTWISSKAVKNNGETDIPIEISIENKDDFLVVNMNVEIEIQMLK